jgi:outer membrane biosynthesis protein TonB
MQKQKIKMNFAQVVQMTAGEHEVIVDNGVVYVAMMSGFVGVTASTPEIANAVAPAVKPAAQKPAPKVVDDTKPSKPATKKAPVKKAPEPEPEVEEEDEEAEEEEESVELSSSDPRAGQTLIENPEEVEEGTNVLVYMATEGLNEQLWQAVVVDGSDQPNYEEGLVFVQFESDGEIDYLRFENGDELYEFDLSAQF